MKKCILLTNSPKKMKSPNCGALFLLIFKNLFKKKGDHDEHTRNNKIHQNGW